MTTALPVRPAPTQARYRTRVADPAAVEAAQRLRRTVFAGEFAARHATAEAGRSCVRPGHRTGAVITVLWAGIARYVVDVPPRVLRRLAEIDR